MTIYVLYHANCVDGLGSRLAAWLALKDTALYFPVDYHKPIPAIPDGSEVYILDFSYPREVLEEMNARMSKLLVLDHHKPKKPWRDCLTLSSTWTRAGPDWRGSISTPVFLYLP
jgi:hypothetical protein